MKRHPQRRRAALAVLAVLALSACATFAGVVQRYAHDGATTNQASHADHPRVAALDGGGTPLIVLANSPSTIRVFDENGLEREGPPQSVGATLTSLAAGPGRRFYGLTDGGTRIRRWDLNQFGTITSTWVVATTPTATDLAIGRNQEVFVLSGAELRRYTSGGAFTHARSAFAPDPTITIHDRRIASNNHPASETIEVAFSFTTLGGARRIRVGRYRASDLQLIAEVDFDPGPRRRIIDFEVDGSLYLFERWDGDGGGDLALYDWTGSFALQTTRNVDLPSRGVGALSAGREFVGEVCPSGRKGRHVWRARAKPFWFGWYYPGEMLERHTLCGTSSW
ncbi:MAG: hypothetical protein KF901_00420 [Myxococcales bacterium]|nr:hypothetical protein [Myxococcales bacterium]